MVFATFPSPSSISFTGGIWRAACGGSLKLAKKIQQQPHKSSRRYQILLHSRRPIPRSPNNPPFERPHVLDKESHSPSFPIRISRTSTRGYTGRLTLTLRTSSMYRLSHYGELRLRLCQIHNSDVHEQWKLPSHCYEPLAMSHPLPQRHGYFHPTTVGHVDMTG